MKFFHCAKLKFTVSVPVIPNTKLYLLNRHSRSIKSIQFAMFQIKEVKHKTLRQMFTSSKLYFSAKIQEPSTGELPQRSPRGSPDRHDFGAL
jgi:hypothetical protein